MTDDHLEAFIRESEESIVELNNSLLALEDDPTDREAMDQIFRTAHTLKGNFSAMGFQAEGKLAHALEDLLDEIREGRMNVTPVIMDHIFDGVDQLEAALDEIEADGESTIDPADTIATIREQIEAEEATGAPAASDDSETPDDPSDQTDSILETALADAIDAMDDLSFVADLQPPIAYLEVSLVESDMPGVDGMLVLESVTEAFDLIETRPDPEAIQDGAFEDGFELFVDEAPERVADELEELSKVDAVSAVEASDELFGAAPVPSTDGGGDTTEPTIADAADDSTESQDEPAVDEIKSVRVDVDQLDQLYGLVEQLVTSRIKLRRAVDEEDVSRAADNMDELDKITSSLQNTVMDMRLIPLRKVVNTFPRLVRDLARDQDKEVDFEMEGTDIELDRTILDDIADPLMHVLRNAVDHGIEPPSVREEKGKPREGEIRLRASRDRDHVTITVEDDGGGLDLDAIRGRASEKGVRDPDELEEMTDSEIYDLIFHPGFSTSEEVTDVSGRGVGMDVVRSTVSRLDGSVSVDSTPDEGTEITLRLPVSVAIVRVLFVDVDGREYGIPIKNVDEITRANGQIKMVHGDEVISHDDDIYSVIRLETALDVGDAKQNGDGMLVRIRESERQVALHCDAVKRQEEVVIKPFEGELANVDGLSGTAVIGDGNVVPILDVGTL